LATTRPSVAKGVRGLSYGSQIYGKCYHKTSNKSSLRR